MIRAVYGFNPLPDKTTNQFDTCRIAKSLKDIHNRHRIVAPLSHRIVARVFRRQNRRADPILTSLRVWGSMCAKSQNRFAYISLRRTRMIRRTKRMGRTRSGQPLDVDEKKITHDVPILTV